MTLKEYLESYDEPLNEGLKGKISDFFNKSKPYRIGMDMIYPPTRAEKIKSWFNKSKGFFKTAALVVGIISVIWSALNLNNASTIAKLNNADRDNLKTYVTEIKNDVGNLKKDYKELQDISKQLSSNGEMWKWENIKPSSEIENKMSNLFKTADDRLEQSEKVLKKYQYKNFADIIFSTPKELADEIKNASDCMKTVKKSIIEIAEEHKNNREVINKHNNW